MNIAPWSGVSAGDVARFALGRSGQGEFAAVVVLQLACKNVSLKVDL